MALLEALGVGTPAVVSPEVERTIGVSAGGAGWLSEPDDLSSLLERPEDLSSDEWARRSTAAKELAGR